MNIANNDIDQFLNTKEFFDYTGYDTLQKTTELNQNQTISKPNKANASDYLVAFSTQPQSVCVGCVDMVNSTKISAMIPPRKLSSYYEIFLNSMSKIIGMYNGKVIKNVGDCLIYYFPEIGKNQSLQNCINCGLAMIKAKEVICNELQIKGLPCLSYRISADFGNVIIMNTTDSSSVDMIGPPVNMATKINHHAKNNEFVIGGDFFELVKGMTGYKFKQVNSCSVGFRVPYPVYKVISS